MSTGLPEKTTPREDEELLLIEETGPNAVDSGSELGAKNDNQETEEIDEEVTTAADQPPATQGEIEIEDEIVDEPYIPSGQIKPRSTETGTVKRDWKSKTAELPSSPSPSSSLSSQKLNATTAAELMTIPNQTVSTASAQETSQVKDTHRDVDKENSKPPEPNAGANLEVIPGKGDKTKVNANKNIQSEEPEVQEKLTVDVNQKRLNEATDASKADKKEQVQKEHTELQNGIKEKIKDEISENEEDFDEIEEFDVSWMHKLKGKDLLKEAEAIISVSMLCIDKKINSPPHWKEVLGEDGTSFGGDINVPIKTILEELTRRFEHYPPYLPAALCLRFSKFYNTQFQPMLNTASQTVNPTDKIILVRRVWTEHMNPVKVRAFCDEKCLLNIPSMISFFRTQDELMNIAECHLAHLSSDPMYMSSKNTEIIDDDAVEDATRATSISEAQVQNDPRNVELTPGESEKILERMGIRNMGVRLLEAIQARVLSYLGIHDSQYCTVGELIVYCTERGKISVVDSGVDLHSKTDASNVDNDEEDKIRDQAGYLQSLLCSSSTSTSLLQRTQIYMKKLGAKFTVEVVEKDGLLKYLYDYFGLTFTREYLNSLLYLIEEPSISGSAQIKLSNVLKFCYPFGYAFKVRTVLGSVFYRDKFSPTGNLVNMLFSFYILNYLECFLLL